MILYLKSSISISAYTGCLIGCKYCILSTCRENNKIWKVIDEDKLIDNLSNYKYFVKDLLHTFICHYRRRQIHITRKHIARNSLDKAIQQRC